ncbi:MAG: hypothetical protein ACXVCH_11720 [Bdellovibrionota bacterium]
MRLRNYGIAFALVFALLLIRGYMRLVQPAIWAEDGLWMASMLEHGIPELFRSEYGYHLVLQKGIVGLATFFPVLWWPVLVTLFCFIAYAALIAPFAGETHAWIIPARRDRLWVCALFAFVPGLPEVLGNSANLGWVFCFYTALVYLKDPREFPSDLEFLIAVLCIGSAGQTAVLLPVLLYRLVLYNREGGPKAFLKPGKRRYLALLLVQLVTIFMNFRARHGNEGYDSARSITGILYSWANGSVRELFLKPILGLHIPYVLTRSAPFLIWVLGALVAAWWIRTVWKSKGWQRLPHLTVLSWSFAIFLVCIVRGWGLEYYSFALIQETSWQSRCSYVLAPGALLLWSLLLQGRFAKYAVAFFSALYITWAVSTGLVLGSYRYFSQWRPFVPVLETSMRTGCPPVVKVPISPSGWSMIYHSGKACTQ